MLNYHRQIILDSYLRLQKTIGAKGLWYFSQVYENEAEVISMNRITNINHDIFNCNHINYLPKIQWKYLNINDYTDLDDNDYGVLKDEIRYGVEVFNNDDEDQVYYLEWDIKEKKTHGDIFRNTLDFEENNDAKKLYTFNEFLSGDSQNIKMREFQDSIYFKDEDINSTKKVNTRSFDNIYFEEASIKNQNCFKMENVAVDQSDHINVIFSENIFGSGDIRFKHAYDSTNTKGAFYDNEGDSNLFFEFNYKLNKWVFWIKPSENAELKIWAGIQEKVQDLYNPNQQWYFSPKYNSPPLSFNFYDYPNPADEKKDINVNDPKLKKIKLTITPEYTPDLEFNNDGSVRQFTFPQEAETAYRCDNMFDKFGKKIDIYDRVIKDDINYYGFRFKNTLFNFISRINLKTDQNKIEVYEFKDDKNNKNARLSL